MRDDILKVCSHKTRNFTKLTTMMQLGTKLIVFWDQKIKGQGPSKNKCTFLPEAYRATVGHRAPSSSTFYFHNHCSTVLVHNMCFKYNTVKQSWLC